MGVASIHLNSITLSKMQERAYKNKNTNGDPTHTNNRLLELFFLRDNNSMLELIKVYQANYNITCMRYLKMRFFMVNFLVFFLTVIFINNQFLRKAKMDREGMTTTKGHRIQAKHSKENTYTLDIKTPIKIAPNRGLPPKSNTKTRRQIKDNTKIKVKPPRSNVTQL